MPKRLLLCLFLSIVFAAAAAQPARVSEHALAAGRPGGTIRVKRGEQVELRWSSDRRMTLHLHGYDVEQTVMPQSSAVMRFKADIAGRFPVSEHGSGGRHGRTGLYLERPA